MYGFLTRIVQCLLVMGFSQPGLSVFGASVNNVEHLIELPHQCRQHNGSVLAVTCDCSNIEVQDVLKALPNTLCRLTIALTTSPQIDRPPVLLENMSRLKNLQYFQLTGGSSLIATIFIFPENTFENLTQLKEVHVNVFTEIDLNTTVKYTTHLEVMDFSGTKLNAISDIQNTLQFVNKSTLKSLLLSDIQLIGTSVFTSALRIDTLFQRTGPLCLEQLDLSSNMLGVIYPSIIKMLPCLKMLDVSFNNLLAYTNDALMIEILLHPSLELINMENQGEGYQLNRQTEGTTLQPTSENEEERHQLDLKTEGTRYQPILQMESTGYKFDWQNPRKSAWRHLEAKGKKHVSLAKIPNSETNQHHNWRSLSNSQTQPSEIVLRFIKCINQNDYHNISNVASNLSIVCSIIRCILQKSPHLLEGIPCEAFDGALDALDTNCLYMIRLPILKKMKHFILRHVNWVARPSNRCSQQICIRETTLQTIDFSGNGDWLPNSFLFDFLNLNNYTSTLKELKFLNLSGNIVTSFPRSSLLDLHGIDLSHNKLQHMNSSVCRLYPNLTHLYLAANQLSDFGNYWVSKCKLLQYLDLSENSINLTECSLNIQYTPQLRMINLNNNKIEILPKYFTTQLDNLVRAQTVRDLSEKLHLTFTGNNILCRCNEETMEFILWFQSTGVNIPNKSSYSCSSSQGELFLSHIDVNNLRTICFPSYKELILKTMLITLNFGVLVLTILALHRYRWRVHYNIVKCFHRVKCHHRHEDEELLPEVDSTTMRYDAFVSYCAEDRFWVHDCLMKTLESDQYGFKLCIHYRDFPVGEEIASVIVRSIRESRKLIIVLSDVAISRPWCQYEFEVALSEAVKRRSQLMVIKLGQIKLDEDNSSLAWVMDNHTYLDWHENADAKKLFWLKLLRAMYGDLSRGVCGCCLDGRQITSREVAAASSPQ